MHMLYAVMMYRDSPSRKKYLDVNDTNLLPSKRAHSCQSLLSIFRVDPNTPVTETFAEMALLVKEGKIKYVGISEASPDDIRKAHAGGAEALLARP